MEMEDRPTETSQSDKKREEKIQNIKDLWDNMERCNKCVFEMSKGEEREHGAQIFEVMMAKNFSRLMLHTSPQIKNNNKKTNLEDTNQDK